MAKAKISVLVEVEYEQNPAYYEPGISSEEMLKVDLSGVEADPFLWIDAPNAKWKITGQIIEA